LYACRLPLPRTSVSPVGGGALDAPPKSPPHPDDTVGTPVLGCPDTAGAVSLQPISSAPHGPLSEGAVSFADWGSVPSPKRHSLRHLLRKCHLPQRGRQCPAPPPQFGIRHLAFGINFPPKQKKDRRNSNAIKLAVIANQPAGWCGNLLSIKGIPTPVCALARNDTVS